MSRYRVRGRLAGTRVERVDVDSMVGWGKACRRERGLGRPGQRLTAMGPPLFQVTRGVSHTRQRDLGPALVEQPQDPTLPHGQGLPVPEHRIAHLRRQGIAGVEARPRQSRRDDRAVVDHVEGRFLWFAEKPTGRRAHVRETDEDAARIDHDDPWKVLARRRQRVVTELAMDRAQTAAPGLEERAVPADPSRDDGLCACRISGRLEVRGAAMLGLQGR